MDYVNSYTKFLSKKLDVKRPLKVVFDCSNGTAGIILKQLLNNESGIRNKESRSKNNELRKNSNSIIHNSKFIILNSRPDGNFPAHGPNPLINGATAELEARVRKEKADLGIVFDADGDRVFFIDNRGRPVDAHEAGYILAQVFKPPFVVSEISSWRLKRLKVSAKGGSASGGKNLKSNVYVSKVGHYFFKNLMRKKKTSLGLEHSGHFYFSFGEGSASGGKDIAYFDSGILAAVEVINFVSRLENGLADWLDALPKYYRSGEINFSAQGGPASGWKDSILRKIEEKYKKQATRISKLDGLTMEFGRGPSTRSGQNSGEFWFNVRPSNTENLLRLNVEAKSAEILKKVTKEVSGLISGK